MLGAPFRPGTTAYSAPRGGISCPTQSRMETETVAARESPDDKANQQQRSSECALPYTYPRPIWLHCSSARKWESILHLAHRIEFLEAQARVASDAALPRQSSGSDFSNSCSHDVPRSDHAQTSPSSGRIGSMAGSVHFRCRKANRDICHHRSCNEPSMRSHGPICHWDEDAQALIGNRDGFPPSRIGVS
jgi:hypothetical protein